MPACRGILGRLFGHRFKYRVGNLFTESISVMVVNHCLRCGMAMQGEMKR